MRTARFSKTAIDQLNTLLAQGTAHYSPALLEDKRQRVFAAIRNHLVHFPRSNRFDPIAGVFFYPVAKTPFVLVYDYDHSEVRIHFVIHKSADRLRLDPSDIDW